MRLLYNLKSHKVDLHMSDSNVGGRKNKSGINHIWIINGIIHDTRSSVKKHPIVIQQYDYRQMFDGMDSSEACGDMYNYGVNDNHLNLLHEANKSVVINVRTPYGVTSDYKITNKVMQGDTWATAMAAAQVDNFGKEMINENPNYMYKYLEEVPIPILGMVDDIIGVAEAGFKTQLLNAFINVKTADKDLQFGADKCKTMTVSKRKPYSFQTPALSVDAWETKHKENGDTEEIFMGEKYIKEESSLMYLGHVLSKNGGNLENIIDKRNKSFGTQKQILKMVEGLGPFRFEGALIYIHTLIRTSILYAAETMYNVTESELRALESIEESVLTQVFVTKRSCPKHLLYLEIGIFPARYQVHRQMLNFLQYILQQPKESLLNRMFMVQQEHPTKGDWVSTVTNLLNKYEIILTLQQIKEMKTTLYKNTVRKQVEKLAFDTLVKKQKQGSKGKQIDYKNLEMADYLLPECVISNRDKIELFNIRTEMNDLPFNYGNKTLCDRGCLQLMDNQHFICCPLITEENEYDRILNGSMDEQILSLRKFQEQKNSRTKLLWDSVSPF